MDADAKITEEQLHAKNSKSSPRAIIIFIIAVFILGSLTYTAVNNKPPAPPAPEPTNQPTASPTPTVSFEKLPTLVPDTDSVNTIIYGEKIKTKVAFANAVNDTGKNNTKIAALLEELKSVIPLANKNQLLYIGDVDATDKGLTLKVKTIEPSGTEIDGKITTIYTVDSPVAFQYKIDKLIISPNHEWIAWSENSPPGTSKDLHEKNYFRSFKAKIVGNNMVEALINPVQLTQEKSDTGITIHLPVIITDSGQVYFDGIKPVGYFIHNGFKNEALQTMLPTNKYNSKPNLIDNRYILYTAFNPQNTPLIPAGNNSSTRIEVINKNIVKVSDLQAINDQPVIAAPGDAGEHYAHPVYISGNPKEEFRIAAEVYIDEPGGESKLVEKEIQVIIRSTDGTFDKKTVLQIPPGESYRILTVGSRPNGNKTIILGKELETLGNLGSGWFVGSSGYQKMISALRIYNVDSLGSAPTEIPLSSTSEFLGVLPKTPGEFLGIKRNEMLDKIIPTVLETENKDRLQLYTYLPVIIKRESGKNSRVDCRNDWQKKGYPNYEECEGCPIYVYSNKVQPITIKPMTPIYQASAIPALQNDSWIFIADKMGNLLFPDESIYKRIDFLFPRSAIAIPNSGKIIQQDNFSQGIYAYAQALGFNDREATDVVNYFLPEIAKSKYIFLSHLSKGQTKNLLDIQVSPQPDIQETRLFYIKKLSQEPVIKPNAPTFAPIIRQGDLTVITWGGIIE